MIVHLYKGAIHSMNRNSLILIVDLSVLLVMNMEDMEVKLEVGDLILRIDSPGNNQ